MALLLGIGGYNTYALADGPGLPGTIDGGIGGINTLDYSAYPAPVVVDLPAGTATGTAGISNIQDIVGGSGNDILIGDDNANTLDGGTGANTVSGGAGHDHFLVSAFDETSGSSFDGGVGHDMLDFSEVDPGLTFTFASLTDLIISDEHGNSITASNVETLFGGSGADTLDFSAITQGAYTKSFGISPELIQISNINDVILIAN